ncbi:MAG: cytochrome-c peroxidase, partial [Phycisphaerales bacterium]|nr:cytochrome-c peroxidase [Phycisphaerales bacterium]
MNLPSAIVRSACIRSKFTRSKIIGLFIACASSSAFAQGLPPVQFPAENQFSVEKSILGKMLFWDEQLSSDNTMSCGTCHINSENGADPRIGVNPGFDLTFGTADDIIGSPGVSTMDSDDKYLKSVLYDLLPQTTGRVAQPSVMAMFANELFWDGRATNEFIDPETGSVVIVAGGALESQAVGPILSNVEMAHDGRDWDHVISKLNRSRPLALASDLTPDMNAMIATEISYPEMFELAFGDDQITAARIGMAIATYERTLLPDQTPWDEFVAGNTAALTPQQQAGLTALQGSRCVTCHTGPRFT